MASLWLGILVRGWISVSFILTSASTLTGLSAMMISHEAGMHSLLSHMKGLNVVVAPSVLPMHRRNLPRFFSLMVDTMVLASCPLGRARLSL